MTKHQRDPSFMDANVLVPETATSILVNGVSNLPDMDFKTHYLKESLQSKFVSDDTDPADLRRSRAIEKWLATEARNAETNDRLLFLDEEYNILPRLSWHAFRAKAREFVTAIIGDSPTTETLIGSFSGGASTSRKRLVSFPANKYLGKADATEPALNIFVKLITEMPGWLGFSDELDFQVVRGNVMFTVPKKTDIDRVACKEPDINMFLQKGVGNTFRTCLRAKGINLNDQSVNRRLARHGAVTGELATLDLSSASDSVSVQLVAELLPPAWFHLLMELRSPITLIDGMEHVNEMLSSMGNGFTFELESLLFYVLARTTAYFEGVRGVISVYGDDIICPTSLAEQLIWVLSVMGFSVNSEKSFVDGTFRESCGGHYNNDRDVTPFYLRAPIRRLSDVIRSANQLRQWAIMEGSQILDWQVYSLWSELADLVPREFWGGRDYSSIYQLVTPGYPRKRLVPVVKRKKLNDLQVKGSYIHWLNTTWVRVNQVTEAVETSQPTDTAPKCRSRPAAKADVYPLSHMFLEEL